jgi:hypothetical protein
MVIKIKKKNKSGEGTHFQYKSFKKILTPQDVKEADRFDLALNKTIKKIEKVLLERKIISRESRKKDSLQVWYIVGRYINKFLKKYPVAAEEKDLFWTYLYGRYFLIHKGIPRHRISQARNDFKTASLLANYPINLIQKVGPWALWREMLGYEIFLKDNRILEFIIDKLVKNSHTRDKARSLFQSLANRLKKIDTSVLNDKELLKILKKFDDF